MRWISVSISVIVTALLGLVVLDQTAHSSAQDGITSPAGHPIVGTWRVFLGDLSGMHGLVTHAADGTMTSSDPVASADPASGDVVYLSAGHGVWESTGPNAVAYTYDQLIADQDGALASVLTVRGTRQIGTDGQTFTSSYVYTVADPAGVVLAEGSGAIRGERMTVEPAGSSSTPAGTPAADTP